MVKVKEIMSKHPVEIHAGKTIREAVSIMTEKKLGSLLVTRNSKIVGLIEEGDIIRKVMANDLNPYVAKVESGMSVPLMIDQENTDDEASEMMRKEGGRHLAVSDGSQIIGIVSMQDLIRPVYAGKSFWG